MNTKNILKTLALAMLLIPACNKSEIANDENTTKKGFALPVTVNVTREGDDATKATYDDGTKKLSFSAGDKLFVMGSHAVAGQFAGALAWQSEGKFSGTVTIQNDGYTGTIDDLMASAAAFLLPDGYESYGFFSIVGSGSDAMINFNFTKAFALTKAAAVEQFSLEYTASYSSGFALAPMSAIASFTISGLTANKEVAVSLDTKGGIVIDGNVTTTAEGVATFAVGVSLGTKLENCTLTVDGNNIAMPMKTVEAGHIYNISRSVPPAGAISGQFSVSATKQVYFSKGNLRYVSGTWSFFDHQYDCYDTYSADAWDKFGWSTSATTYGMSTSSDNSDYSGDFVDWGTVPGIGEGWYTLSKDEWYYLFKTRSDAANKYGYATVNGVHGIIILPDAFDDPKKNKGSNAFVGSTTKGWGANEYTAENWALMEAAGAVFLPAGGYRLGASVSDVGERGYYWSSSAYGGDRAYYVEFYLDSSYSYLYADSNFSRFCGLSVRLVR